MAGMLIDYMNMKNGKYHEKQIKYNMTALINDIKSKFPDDLNVENNLSDPKYREIVKNSPFNPIMEGGIIRELGLQNEVLSLEMWGDFSAGWARADKINVFSPLYSQIVDTPRGKMVKLNANALKMDPTTGSYIMPKKGKDKERRIGTELIFGMGQNLSTKLANMEIADPEVGKRYKEIADRVYKEKIIPELTKDALIRTGKDGANVVRAAEIMVVRFAHPENRSENPFRHDHFFIGNTALGEDGKLYSLSNDQIMKNKDKYSAIFMGAMKEELEREFGFKFKKVFLKEDAENEFLDDSEKNVASYDLIDEFVPEQVKDYMQARTKEMEKHLKDQGKGMSFIELENARLETRDEKSELSHSELKEKWKKDFERLDYHSGYGDQHLDFNQKKTQPLENGRLLNPMEEEALVENFLRKHKDIAFTEEQFKAHVMKQLMCDYSVKNCEREAEAIFSTQCLQMLSPEKHEYYKDLLEDRILDPVERQAKQIRYAKDLSFTFKSVRQKDLDIIEAFNRKKDDRRFVFDKEEVEKFIYKFEAEATEELRKKKPKAVFKFATGKSIDPNKPEGQRQAIIDSITQPGLGWVIKGRAGAGKSTLVKAIKEFYEEKGFTMYGTSTSGKATKGLAESINLRKGKFYNSAELIKLIEKKPDLFNDKSILVVDEAGMQDLTTSHKLITYCDKVGAKILLVGESEQLQAVGYGDSFKYIGERYGLTEVKDINRQYEDWQREMVEDFASGRSQKAVKTLYDKGDVVLTKTEEERLNQLVKDYVGMTTTEKKEVNKREWKDGKLRTWTETVETTRELTEKEKLVVATTNMDVDKVNNAIRAELKKIGKLPSDPKEQVIVQGKDGVERDFVIGDRVIFSSKTKSDNADRLKVDTSTTGTITGFQLNKKNQPIALRIMTDEGNIVFLNTNKELAIKHGFCSTVHKSQGDTKQKAQYYVSPTMNSLHLAYVAMSRHREQVKMYLSEEMADKLVEKMEDREPTELMKKICLDVAKNNNLEFDQESLSSFKECRAFLNDHYAKYDDTKSKDDPIRHEMDDYTQIVESFSRTSFKKSTFDFTILDGEQVNIYNSIKEEKELVREIKPEIKTEIKPNAPEQKQEVSQSVEIKPEVQTQKEDGKERDKPTKIKTIRKKKKKVQEKGKTL